MARIRCFSRKVKISKGVGKNIEKAYKIVLFCKNREYPKCGNIISCKKHKQLNNNMRCFEIRMCSQCLSY